MGNMRKSHFRNTNSKSGEVTIKIKKSLATRLKAYAKSENQSFQSIVNGALAEYLEDREKDMFMAMTKEDLIKIILDDRKGA